MTSCLGLLFFGCFLEEQLPVGNLPFGISRVLDLSSSELLVNVPLL